VQHVFDRDLKRTQRDIAATRPNSAEYDYIRDEISDRLVDRLLDIKRDFRTVLDLGCHSGHIAKSLQKQSERLGEGDSLMGIESLTQVDRSEKMLKRDEDLVVLPSSVQHEMLVADEEDLPFESESFDLIISNLSLHWVNNLPGTLSQVKRLLKPDGAFIASMFGGDTLRELRTSFYLADLERDGGVSPHVSPFAEVADCGMLLQQAGFSLPTVDTDTFHIEYPCPFTLMEHLQGMGEGNVALQRRSFVPKETFLATASMYQTMYGLSDESIPATFQVNYMIGWSPHTSQQQPLNRGSGEVSLKDVVVDKG